MQKKIRTTTLLARQGARGKSTVVILAASTFLTVAAFGLIALDAADGRMLSFGVVETVNN